MRTMTGVAKTPSASPPSPGLHHAGRRARAVIFCTQRIVERNSAGDDGHDDRHERVERQVHGDERIRPRVGEERALAEERDETSSS